MRERTIIVDGFSKAYAMTGWRLGYAIMPETLGEDGDAVQQQHVHLRRNVRADGRHRRARPGPTKPVRAHERDVPPAPRPARRRAQRDPRHLVHDARRRVLRLPQRDARSRTTTSALAKFLLEEGGVACGGGSSFGAAGKGYLRFSYAASLDDIDWALDSIAKMLPKFKG